MYIIIISTGIIYIVDGTVFGVLVILILILAISIICVLIYKKRHKKKSTGKLLTILENIIIQLKNLLYRFLNVYSFDSKFLIKY